MKAKLRAVFIYLLLFVGIVSGVAYVTRSVRDDLHVLCSFENRESLKQALRPDTYAVAEFSQGGQDYIGVRVDSHRVQGLFVPDHFGAG